MSDNRRKCCCGGLSGDCPCHSFYGGRATYTATWTGSVTATEPDCACIYGLYGPPPGNPATFADKVKPTETWSAGSTPITVSWQSNDPLNQFFCRLTGSTPLSPITFQEVQLFNSTCTEYGSPFSVNVNLIITLLAPDLDSGRDYWEADCSMTGLLRVKYRSLQLTCLPTIWVVNQVVNAPPAGCSDFYGVATWTHTIGTFSLS